MGEWKEVKLGDVAIIKNGFAFKSEDFLETGIPIIKIKNVKPNKIVLDTLSYVSPETAKGKDNFFIKPNDILITMSGNRVDGSTDSWVGKVSQFRIEGKYLLNQRVSKIVINEALASIPFIAYNLSSWQIQLHLINTANSSGGQANISPDTVKEICLSLPPLTEQKAIGTVLSSLDDKIDLLHRQNKTLETMAETLFRQWFIEDDNNTNYPFGKLVESVSVTHSFPEKTIIFLNTSDIYDGHVINRSYSVVKTLPGQAKKSIKKGDILFTEIRPANRRFAYINFDADDYVVSTKLMVLRSKGVLSDSIMLFFLKIQENLDWLQMLAESRSGTFPQITFDDFRSLEIFVPPKEKLAEITDLLDVILEKTYANQSQIQSLEKLRDNLLPKLMSGEVRVNYE